MINLVDLQQILFIDIETVSQQPVFGELSDPFKSLWKTKAKQLLKLSNEDELTEEMAMDTYTNRAAIFAEFGKVVCISVGFVALVNGTRVAKFKSFAGDDERQLLLDFDNLLQKHYDQPEKQYLCGHNIKEFDVPYICRRLMVHQLPFPKMLNIHGKKPWETKHLLDTMELWKFGDGKAYTALKLLTAIFGIPSPKDDIDGSEVGRVYWEEQNVSRIAKYCEKDVLAVIQLMLRFKYMPLLNDEEILFSIG